MPLLSRLEITPSLLFNVCSTENFILLLLLSYLLFLPIFLLLLISLVFFPVPSHRSSFSFLYVVCVCVKVSFFYLFLFLFYRLFRFLLLSLNRFIVKCKDAKWQWCQSKTCKHEFPHRCFALIKAHHWGISSKLLSVNRS